MLNDETKRKLRELNIGEIIDAIEALGIDPTAVAPDHWRHVHNRLTAGQTPSVYSSARHAAWLARRRIWP